jgi:hypothetical protein
MEVMQAYLDGKKIEYCFDGRWYVTKVPDWNWRDRDFRVKQEPREFFIVLDGQGSPVGVGASNGCAKIPSGTDMRSLNTVKVREVL